MLHAQVCIPRTALPVSQMNQVSLWITIKGDQKKVSERERAKAKQSSERQKNSDINLSFPSEDPSDPAGPINHRDLEHLAAHYGSCPSCEKHSRAHSYTLPTINTSPPPPCILSATCLSLAASEHRKTWHVPAEGFPLILTSNSHMRNESSLPVSLQYLLCSCLSGFLVTNVLDPDKTACRKVQYKNTV